MTATGPCNGFTASTVPATRRWAVGYRSACPDLLFRAHAYAVIRSARSALLKMTGVICAQRWHFTATIATWRNSAGLAKMESDSGALYWARRVVEEDTATIR